MHGKTAQTQAQQQSGHGDVTGHFATHADAFAPRLAFGNGAGHQLQHRWVQWVVQMGHGFVHPVDGQGVLDQVVGADGEKIEVLEEQAHGQRCRWHFDHGAEAYGAMHGRPVIELFPGTGQQGLDLLDFARMCQHGYEQVDLAMRRRPQDGAQLGEKHGRFGQAPAYGPQTQRRVEVIVAPAVVQRLVGPHIHRADGDRQTVHAFHRRPVGLVLFFFVGQFPVTAHEQELGAEQAHPDGTHRKRRHGVGRLLDVGQEFHALAVQRHGRGVLDARQPFAFDLALALLVTVFGQHHGRRIDDDDTRIAVDDHPVVLLHQLAGVARAHHRRNVHAAGHDGGVAGLATHIGHETVEDAVLELQHVGRRQVMGHQHQWIHRVERGLWTRHRRRRNRRSHPPYVPQHAFDHLLQVGLALAQVGVFHLVELLGDQLQLRGQRPFGVVVPLLHPVFHPLLQLLVLQQHQVHIQQGGEFRVRPHGRGFLQALLHMDDFGGHGVARMTQASQFDGHLLFGDEVVRHIQPAGRHQHCPPDGDASGNRLSMDGKGHSPSPNLSSISASRAAMASCSWSPSVSISTSAPKPAASIITPMMLLALTRRPLRLSQTSHGKLPASLVSLADARACRPSLLLMVAVVLIMGRAAILVLLGRHGNRHHPLGAAQHGA